MTTMEHRFYSDIWDILVSDAGASTSPSSKSDFIAHCMSSRDPFEFRFQGKFGFGGKLWRDGVRFYVGYYSEDHTPELDRLLEAVNAKITKLVAERVTWKGP